MRTDKFLDSPCSEACSKSRAQKCLKFDRCSTWRFWFDVNWRIKTRYLREHNYPVVRKVKHLEPISDEARKHREYLDQLYRWGTWKHDGT